MAPRLLNIEMHDGSRQFGELPQTASWHELRKHLSTLSGVTITDFITDDITEAWIDFNFRGQHFSVNNQFGDYWFFVKDALSPEEILETVLSHCRRLLGDEREPVHLDGAA